MGSGDILNGLDMMPMDPAMARASNCFPGEPFDLAVIEMLIPHRCAVKDYTTHDFWQTSQERV